MLVQLCSVLFHLSICWLKQTCYLKNVILIWNHRHVHLFRISVKVRGVKSQEMPQKISSLSNLHDLLITALFWKWRVALKSSRFNLQLRENEFKGALEILAKITRKQKDEAVKFWALKVIIFNASHGFRLTWTHLWNYCLDLQRWECDDKEVESA